MQLARRPQIPLKLFSVETFNSAQSNLFQFNFPVLRQAETFRGGTINYFVSIGFLGIPAMARARAPRKLSTGIHVQDLFQPEFVSIEFSGPSAGLDLRPPDIQKRGQAALRPLLPPRGAAGWAGRKLFCFTPLIN